MSLDDSRKTKDLLEQARSGSWEAFDALFARHRDRLRQAIALRLERRLRVRVDASDVVQEAQLDAYQRLTDYLERRPMPFHVWLRKTAHERLIKVRERHLQAARRSVLRESPLPDNTAAQLARQLADVASSPTQQAMKRELIQQVRKALAQLSETDREILLMRYTEKLSNAEVGYVLDLTPAAVSKRHGRALLQLEKLLRDRDG